jgi:hypothetical protein
MDILSGFKIIADARRFAEGSKDVKIADTLKAFGESDWRCS